MIINIKVFNENRAAAVAPHGERMSLDPIWHPTGGVKPDTLYEKNIHTSYGSSPANEAIIIEAFCHAEKFMEKYFHLAG